MYLIICGGGNKISYLLGVKKYIEEKELNIEKYSGSSIGAIFSVLLICGIPNNIIIKNYYDLNRDIKECKCKLDYIKLFLENTLPKNAHKLCDGKLYISATEVKTFSWKNKFFNKFRNNQELIDCILASCSVPFIINNKLTFNLNNSKYIDGSLSREAHLFVKNNSKNQIIIKPWYTYPIDLGTFDFRKKISDKKMLKGYFEMKEFVEEGEKMNQFVISNNLQDTKLMIFFLALIYIFNLLND